MIIIMIIITVITKRSILDVAAALDPPLSKKNIAIFSIKPYILDQSLLVYSTIHFRYFHKLNGKNK